MSKYKSALSQCYSVILLFLTLILPNGESFTSMVVKRVTIYKKSYYSLHLHPTKKRQNNNIPLTMLSLGNNVETKNENDLEMLEENDYLITDSQFLEESSRPSFIQSIQNPRDILALLVVFNGMIISYFNIIGKYSTTYIQIEQCAIGLGVLSSIAYMIQIVTGYQISPNVRRGVVDEAVINLYAAMYTFAVSWLALRASENCPGWLLDLDVVLPWLSVAVFAYSLVAPLATLIEPTEGSSNTPCTWIVKMARGIQNNKAKTTTAPINSLPTLSETELLRARGLLFIGVFGCIFLPISLTFAIEGQSWWNRVYELHPSQRMLESSTSLFALFATEASMIAHRMAKYGVATFKVIVPSFASVCFVLAVVPCICALHWLGSDISFFSLYWE